MCLLNHQNVSYIEITVHKIHPFTASASQIFLNISFATSPNIILSEQNKEPPSDGLKNVALSLLTRRWRKADSNRWSHLRQRC
jgi:hypothetical protein